MDHGNCTHPRTTAGRTACRKRKKRNAAALAKTTNDLFANIEEFVEGRGWRALGYKTLREWAESELPPNLASAIH